VTTYSILKKSGGTVAVPTWAFDDISGDRSTVLARLKTLVEESGSASVKLVQEVLYSVGITPDIPVIEIDHVSVVNDGHELKMGVFFVEAPIGMSKNIAVDIDPAMKAALLLFLSNLGLTNIELNTWNGLTATNPTGTPIHASYNLPEGFFEVYQTGSGSLGISAAYTVVLGGN